MKNIQKLTAFFFICIVLILACNKAPEKAENSFLYASDENTIANGKALYEQYCESCHLLNGDAIGPPLGGVTHLLSFEELSAYIENPAKSLENNNVRTRYLFDRYKVLMPPFNFLEETQVNSILSYIHAESERLRLLPLLIDSTRQFRMGDRLIDSVATSGLVIELKDYTELPMQEDRDPSKGFATLRAHFSDPNINFIGDQMGIIYRVDSGKPSIFFNLRKIVPDFIFKPGLGTGLNSFDFHPDFLENGLFYTSHAEEYKGKEAQNTGQFEDSLRVALQWVISEWKMKEPTALTFEGNSTEPRELLRVNMPTSAHGIQDIQFARVKKGDPDYGKLFIGIGDGGSVNRKRPDLSHNIRSLLGTVLRIDPLGRDSQNGQYGIPTDNPFYGNTDSQIKQEIWAYGFRNPHRMCWDTANGKLMFVAEVGESNIEEVNIVTKGGDYGWNLIEGAFGIDIKKDQKTVFEADETYLENFKLPYGQIDHYEIKAISGGFVYRGPIESLKSKYIFGDIVSGKLYYMNINPGLSDSTIYRLNIVRNGDASSMKEISNVERAHLRIGYNERSGDLFLMCKADSIIHKVVNAYFNENSQ